MRSRRVAVLLAAVGLLGGLSTATGRAQTVVPLPTGALMQLGTLPLATTSSYQDWNWANPDPVNMYADAAGDLDVVRHTSDTLTVTAYDLKTLSPVGTVKTISLDGWPDWGGFYAGPDGYFYVLVGKENPTENDSLQVVALRRYDANWNLVGTAYVDGGASQGLKGIFTPFDAGQPHMLLVGDRLVVHMSRLIYATPEGVHHQVNFTFEVNTGTMTATTFEQLGDYSYSSHSFQQLIAMNGPNLVMIDHGDAFPRSIQMGVMAGYPDQRTVTDTDLYDFNGAEGDNFTGASVTGLVSGPEGIVVLGNSIQQPDAPNGPEGSSSERRNIFAIWADPHSGDHTVHWLTNFPANGPMETMEPRAVQVGTDQFAVLYGLHSGTLYGLQYELIDSAGRVLASALFPNVFHASISDPLVIGNTIYWIGNLPTDTSTSRAYLFGVDVASPTTPTLSTTERTITPAPGTIAVVNAPQLSGQFHVGSTVHVSQGQWAPSPATVHFQWYRNGSRISGATGQSYRIKSRDRGAQLRVAVAVSDPGYKATSTATSVHRVR